MSPRHAIVVPSTRADWHDRACGRDRILNPPERKRLQETDDLLCRRYPVRPSLAWFAARCPAFSSDAEPQRHQARRCEAPRRVLGTRQNRRTGPLSGRSWNPTVTQDPILDGRGVTKTLTTIEPTCNIRHEEKKVFLDG